MKVGKNIYYFPGRKKQKYLFDKRINGKRFCRGFTTLIAAEEYAQNFLSTIHSNGAQSLFFLPEEREQIKKIRKICGDFDPVEAVKFWKTHYSGKTASAPALEECFAEFIDWLEKSGRSERHIDNIRYSRERFLATFHGRRLESIRKQDLLDWIMSFDKFSARTKKNLWTNIHNFLSWCKTAKSWIIEVPEIDERLLPIAPKKPVEIWTFPEAEFAIRWIEKNKPEYIPHFALRLFAGLRTSEAEQMRWEWIDFDNHRITVPAEICKTRDAWILLPEFCPETVFAWLAPFRQPAGKIAAPSKNIHPQIAAACHWKRNVMRHTFATMHVARFHDESKTILATRHTNVAMLRANYRGVNQTHSDAQKFFALRPLRSTAENKKVASGKR